jgi:hypothetical protein
LKTPEFLQNSVIISLVIIVNDSAKQIRSLFLFKWNPFVAFLLVTVLANSVCAQSTGHIFGCSWKKDSVVPSPRFPIEHFIVPAAMITYGLIALKSDLLQDLDENTQEEIWADHPHKHTTVDNYLQYAPAAVVYGLNLAGICGVHNFIDRTGILVMSNIFVGITVTSLKNITHQMRPDSSDYLSFPSGHTAEAFANAEFLRLEYRHRSVWYGIGGYVIAGFTGYLRMYNNKHYLSDVIAGAGIGILSTDLSYWLYPKIKRIFIKQGIPNTMVLPFYHSGAVGLAMTYSFP